MAYTFGGIDRPTLRGNTLTRPGHPLEVTEPSNVIGICTGTLREDSFTTCPFGCKVHACTKCDFKVEIHPRSYGHSQEFRVPVKS